MKRIFITGMLGKITEIIYPSGAPVLRLEKHLASEGRLAKEVGTPSPRSKKLYLKTTELMGCPLITSGTVGRLDERLAGQGTRVSVKCRCLIPFSRMSLSRGML